MLVSIHLSLLAKHAKTLNHMLFKKYTHMITWKQRSWIKKNNRNLRFSTVTIIIQIKGEDIKIRLKHLQVRQVIFAHITAKQEKWCELIHVFVTWNLSARTSWSAKPLNYQTIRKMCDQTGNLLFFIQKDKENIRTTDTKQQGNR